MTELIKVKLGMIAVILGILGTGFGVGGVENSITNTELLASVGVAAASLLLMWIGTLLVREEI